MGLMDDKPLPPGHQPYDPLNGLRVGALAGGLLGAPLTALTRSPWFVIGGAGLGAVAGYLRERGRLESERDKLT
jgi:hypothetical protein